LDKTRRKQCQRIPECTVKVYLYIEERERREHREFRRGGWINSLLEFRKN